MNIIVTNIEREIFTLEGDGMGLGISPTRKYNVKFHILVDGGQIYSNISIVHEGDLSFEQAAGIIKEKIREGVKE